MALSHVASAADVPPARRYDGLVEGRARFTADLPAPGALHLHFVRSPHAHARITRVDTTAARACPGVVAVYTADDLDLVPIWEIHLIPESYAMPPLARDVVRFVGERVVAIVADTLTAAIDAAELVVVDYEPITPIVRAADALTAAPVFADRDDNVALAWDAPGGDGAAAQPDDVTVSGVVEMPRLAVAPMEGLSVLVTPSDDGSITVHASTQSPAGTRVQIARSLGVDVGDVRVVVPHVGGAFGGKSLGGIAEYVVAAAAARELGRAVRYTEDRSTNLATMHGRGVRLECSVRTDADGRIRSVEVDELCDAGAYPQTNTVEPGKTQMMLCGPYRVPSVRFRARSVVTNLAPNGAYRGPGRSEATAALERALDTVAARLGIDPVEIRRRNLLRRDELPHETVTGVRYDETDHHALLDELVARSGYERLRADQQERRARRDPLQLGIGVATVVDSTAWFARTEPVRVAIDRDGTVRVFAATASAGQQHAAAFVSIVRSVLPVPAERVLVVEGDTAHLESAGTSGSRSLQLAGSAIRAASEVLLDALRHHAADALEAAPEDVVLDDGRFVVRGSPAARAVSFADALAFAHDRDGTDVLDARCVYEQPHPTYPTAAHLSVVEVDVETGGVRALRHVAVTDCGVVVDEVGARGQVVGATAQGIAQALYEQVVYGEDGTPRNASFAEYLLPAATEQPPIEAHFLPTVGTTNRLGAKGVGEIGMVAAPAAVWNAVVDALRPFGVDHVELPCTPERVRQAISRSRAYW